MEIKPLEEHNTYDVFVGNGWTNHLRVQLGSGKEIIVLAKADQVRPTDKLLELIYYKIRKLQHALHNAGSS